MQTSCRIYSCLYFMPAIICIEPFLLSCNHVGAHEVFHREESEVRAKNKTQRAIGGDRRESDECIASQSLNECVAKDFGGARQVTTKCCSDRTRGGNLAIRVVDAGDEICGDESRALTRMRSPSWSLISWSPAPNISLYLTH